MNVYRLQEYLECFELVSYLGIGEGCLLSGMLTIKGENEGNSIKKLLNLVYFKPSPQVNRRRRPPATKFRQNRRVFSSEEVI